MVSKNYHQTSYENAGNVKIKTSYTGPENVVNVPVFLKIPNRQLNCKSNILDITSVHCILIIILEMTNTCPIKRDKYDGHHEPCQRYTYIFPVFCLSLHKCIIQ